MPVATLILKRFSIKQRQGSGERGTNSEPNIFIASLKPDSSAVFLPNTQSNFQIDRAGGEASSFDELER